MAHRLFPYSASVLVKWNCIEDNLRFLQGIEDKFPL